MKQEIAKKLKLGERSINLILQNTELCKRILEETPIKLNHFAIKYEVSISGLKTMISKGVISSFSNNPNKGSSIFLFEDEVLNFIKAPYTNNKVFAQFKAIGKLYLSATANILTDIEFKLVMSYFDESYSVDIINELSYTRINQIRNKAFKKLFRYSDKLVLTNEIMLYEEELNRILQKKRSIKHIPKSIKIKKELELVKLLDVSELDLSVRAYNCLHANGIKYLGELLQYSISDIAKFRNCGKQSIKEIENIVSEYGLKLADY